MAAKNRPLLPWLTYNPAMDEAIERLIETRAAPVKRTHRQLSAQETLKLKTEFKNAQQARSKGVQLLRSIGEAIGVENIHTSISQPPMKSWDRIIEKKEAGRSTRDIGRGRLYIKHTTRYPKLIKLFDRLSYDGELPNISIKDISIIPSTVQNYLKKARKSGFAGMFNFDCAIDLGMGRVGNYEAQIMPRGYEEVDKHSHRIFELIRIFQDIPSNYLTQEDETIRDTLIIANRALYTEHGIRTGFVKFREDKWNPNISSENANEISDILDRIRTAIEEIPGRNFTWRKETCEAMTYAKTSVQQISRLPKNFKLEHIGNEL